ncbi:hypothetical protein V6Z11_D03G074400 [Gossypium hirsutum]
MKNANVLLQLKITNQYSATKQASAIQNYTKYIPLHVEILKGKIVMLKLMRIMVSNLPVAKIMTMKSCNISFDISEKKNARKCSLIWTLDKIKLYFHMVERQQVW